MCKTIIDKSVSSDATSSASDRCNKKCLCRAKEQAKGRSSILTAQEGRIWQSRGNVVEISSVCGYLLITRCEYRSETFSIGKSGVESVSA